MSTKAVIVFLLRYAAGFAAAGFFQYFLYRYIKTLTQDVKRIAFPIFGLFNVITLFIILDYFLHLTLNQYVYMLIWPLAIGFHLISGFFVIFRSMAWILTGFLKKPDRVQRERRSFIAGTVAGFFAGTVFTYAARKAAGPFKITRVKARVKGIGRPFTIAHVTDIHAGWYFGPARIQSLKDSIMELKPDLIVFTGDQLHGNHYPFLIQLRDNLKGIHAPMGVFQVSGNHDHRTGKELLFRELERIGIKYLDNAVTIIKNGNKTFQLAGVDDIFYQGDVDEVIDKLDKSQPVILLSHRPELMDEQEIENFDLVLAGHTHGGQLCVGALCASDYETTYRYGMYKKNRTLMFVSSGAGITGPPMRIGTAPEIALITVHDDD
ncbi:metallophosphoesterase [Myxococcota bacterium]|nr:metallophosphoesterase [Myxococcota bacterium]MBU1379718.1 metallophosphoesterase [Myxococcota bacterium]MBU1498809.1 metallophosphoesterase [Myxococcota bacterium]